MSRQPVVSVVVVAYHAAEAFDACIDSITKHTGQLSELVIVDNERVNRGFSGGVNVGVNLARGKYVLVLNPDCEIYADTIPMLLQAFKTDEKVGVAAPQLIDERGDWYLSYSQQPNWLTSPVVYSGLNRLLSQTSLVRRHWFYHQSSHKAREVGIVSGAAMLIRRDVFLEHDGFDERFFMYWEEVDLCRRLIDERYSVEYRPQARVRHLGGASSPSRTLRMRWFRRSRRHFFSKHFGWIYAFYLETWLRLTESWRWVVGLVIAGLFYRLIWS